MARIIAEEPDTMNYPAASYGVSTSDTHFERSKLRGTDPKGRLEMAQTPYLVVGYIARSLPFPEPQLQISKSYPNILKASVGTLFRKVSQVFRSRSWFMLEEEVYTLQEW